MESRSRRRPPLRWRAHALRTPPWRLSLAGQLLLLQIVTIVVVLVATGVASFAQSAESLRHVDKRKAEALAEDVAGGAFVRQILLNPAQHDLLKSWAEGQQVITGASFIIIATKDQQILTSPDPSQLGKHLPVGNNDTRAGKGWTGAMSFSGATHIVALTPVISEKKARLDTGEGSTDIETGDLIGFVAVGRPDPTIWQRLGDAAPHLLLYLGVASALGVAGSLLAARRVKRQTLGLEPQEITGLVEHREAMLHGIREGVLSLNLSRRVTLVNDQARHLLHLPADCVGRPLAELGLDRRLVTALAADRKSQDEIVLLADRVLTLSRMPIHVRGRAIGTVSTLRDHTELVTLQRELGVSRHATDTLRAQAHEFSNQLHTISGLIQLGEYDDVIRFVQRVSSARTTLTDEVTARVADPALAALLIAKTSQATERGLRLRLSPDTRLLDPLPEDLSDDLTTVVGNLVDNALDAAAPERRGWVEVEIAGDAGEVRIVVRDSGPGVAPDALDDVFEHGYTTKTAVEGCVRGFGLALTRVVCTRRGGGIMVHNDHGAVFTARLPLRGGVPT